MNLLGHLSLSQREPAIMLGNFAGDFVKGRRFERFSPAVAKGILLHRQIDSFTDAHPALRASSARFREAGFGKYAPVVADVCYDYFLTRNWQTFHPDALPDFVAFCYEQLLARQEELPEQARHALQMMARHDWLNGYAKPEGIRRALAGIARRSPYAEGLDAAVETMLLHAVDFEAEFLAFYPEALAFVADFLS